MTKTFLAAITITAAPALALALASSAAATTARLDLGGIDRSTEAGRAELARRIDAAVLAACPLEVPTGSHIGDRKERALCMADIREQIEARLASRPPHASYGR